VYIHLLLRIQRTLRAVSAGQLERARFIRFSRVSRTSWRTGGFEQGSDTFPVHAKPYLYYCSDHLAEYPSDQRAVLVVNAGCASLLFCQQSVRISMTALVHPLDSGPVDGVKAQYPN
jgi:hypothetical protein